MIFLQKMSYLSCGANSFIIRQYSSSSMYVSGIVLEVYIFLSNKRAKNKQQQRHFTNKETEATVVKERLSFQVI